MLRFAMNSPGNGNCRAGFAGSRQANRFPALVCFMAVMALHIVVFSALDFFEPAELCPVKTGDLSLILETAGHSPGEAAAREAAPDVPLSAPLPAPLPAAVLPHEEVPLPEPASGEVPLPQEETVSGAASLLREETDFPAGGTFSASGGGEAENTGNAAPSAAPGKAPMTDAEYMVLIMDRLEKNKVYPRSVRKRGIEGDITTAFTIRRDGTVSDMRLADPSGHRFLAQAAFETIRSASPFPVMEGRDEDYPVRVSIRYRLEE